MNELSTISLLGSSTAIAIAYPKVVDRYAYKKLIDAVKALKAKTPDVVRADIEVQVSLADAIDEALATGEATSGHTGAYQVDKHEINGAEVDRWRKLRAIPDDARQAYSENVVRAMWPIFRSFLA